MNYKRRHKFSRSSKKCGICCGQRRHFGPPERTKARLKVMDREMRKEYA